jgi:hypothetical protein
MLVDARQNREGKPHEFLSITPGSGYFCYKDSDTHLLNPSAFPPNLGFREFIYKFLLRLAPIFIKTVVHIYYPKPSAAISEKTGVATHQFKGVDAQKRRHPLPGPFAWALCLGL